jgi:hypothetical protein
MVVAMVGGLVGMVLNYAWISSVHSIYAGSASNFLALGVVHIEMVGSVHWLVATASSI